MNAHIRNRLDTVLERMYADASVADQLEFQSWPERSKAIARKAVALEIDEAAVYADSDVQLGEAITAVKIMWEELKTNLPDAVEKSDSAGDIARARVLALVGNIDEALVELRCAAEAEPE